MMIFASKEKQLCGQDVSFPSRSASITSEMVGSKQLSVNRPLSLHGV
jgi:hypothetical protein